MNHFIALLKREYWEWKRVVFWTVGVFSFLLLLTLIPLNRMNTFMQDKIRHEIEKNDNNDEAKSEIKSFLNEMGRTEEEADSLISMLTEMQNLSAKYSLEMSEKIETQIKEKAKQTFLLNPNIVIKPYSYGILAGFSMIQLFVLFIGLFYFSDSLYKERSNNSTFFYRSLPINDNWILFSKLKAGSVGIIGLTVTMLIILLAYSHIAIMTVSGDIWDIISGPLSQINMIDLFFDLIVYQVVALIWMSPLILFLMLVSATVKNRPLIVGVGVPILISITLTVIYGENAFVMQIGDIFGAIAIMITEQNLIGEMTVAPESGVDLFGSFFSDVFSTRTLGSLIVSGLFYIATWKMYRKNITTN